MTEDKELQLTSKYPLLYGDRAVCYCSDGWFDIIDRLSAKLEFLNKVVGARNHITIKALQVKEKFGGLRFYTTVEDLDENSTDPYHKEVYDKMHSISRSLIRVAEEDSEDTCEICGKSGAEMCTVHNWMRTLCKDCNNKLQAERSYEHDSND